MYKLRPSTRQSAGHPRLTQINQRRRYPGRFKAGNADDLETRWIFCVQWKYL